MVGELLTAPECIERPQIVSLAIKRYIAGRLAAISL
jgi:hypothetical protein